METGLFNSTLENPTALVTGRYPPNRKFMSFGQSLFFSLVTYSGMHRSLLFLQEYMEFFIGSGPEGGYYLKEQNECL